MLSFKLASMNSLTNLQSNKSISLKYILSYARKCCWFYQFPSFRIGKNQISLICTITKNTAMLKRRYTHELTK